MVIIGINTRKRLQVQLNGLTVCCINRKIMKGKIAIFISILVFANLMTLAQTNFLYNQYDVYSNSRNNYLKTKSNIKSHTNTVSTEKGIRYTTIKEYNRDGYLTKMEKKGKKHETKYTYKWEYQENNLLKKRMKYNKKGKLVSTLSFFWNTSDKITEKIGQNKKGDTTFRNTWTYTEANKIKENTDFKGKGNKIRKQWKYIYDDKDQLLQTQLFSRKGKVKHIWSYDCHEEGALLDKQKNKTQICQWSEDKGKYLIKTYQSFDEDGKINKSVYTYTKEDTVRVEYKRYNSKSELVNHTLYNENGFISDQKYFKKGKVVNQHVYTYAGKKYETLKYYTKGRFQMEYKYSYDDKGNLHLIKYYDKKNILKSTTTNTYVMYNK